MNTIKSLKSDFFAFGFDILSPQIKYKGLDNFQCDQQDGDAGEIRTPDRRLRRPHRSLSQFNLADICGGSVEM